MAYKIKTKETLRERWADIEQTWEMKRAKAKAEREAFAEKKKEHERKLNDIYQQEKAKLQKEKEAKDELEAIKKAKAQARKDVYLSPEKQKKQHRVLSLLEEGARAGVRDTLNLLK